MINIMSTVDVVFEQMDGNVKTPDVPMNLPTEKQRKETASHGSSDEGKLHIRVQIMQHNQRFQRRGN